MSDIQHIDTDSDEWENTPKALRDQVKKLQKALTESTQTITEFRTRETDTALTGVLAGFKSPGKVKRDLLADGVDPLDSEAVTKWVGENGSDYAQAPAPAAEPSEEPAPNDPFAVVEQQSSPADKSKYDVAFAGITPDMDGAAVAEHFRKHGI